MSEQKRYTAQEMRETEKRIRGGLAWYDGSDTPEIRKTMKGADCDTAWRMLRQAADAEEELANLKTTSGELEKRALEYADHGVSSPLLANTIKRLIAERNSLKARLEAVVKECEKQIPACRGEDCKCNPTDSGYCDENCHDEIIVHTAVTAILRSARGDAGKEER